MIRALDNLCDLSQFPDLTKAGKIINRIYLSWNNLFKLVLNNLASNCESWMKWVLAKLTESSVLVYESNWSCTVLKCTNANCMSVMRDHHNLLLILLVRINDCLGLYSQVIKCMWWMPWQSEAKKDVIACEKLRGGGKYPVIRRCLNGETHLP